MSTTTRKPARTLVGTVTSNKMQKTVVVETVRTVQHPVYHKHVKKHHSFKAHDEKNEAKVGAKVRIAATRPLSKSKRWRLVEIIEQGPEEQK